MGAIAFLDVCCWGFQVRDYIHVMDLASGHSQALKKLFNTPDLGRCCREVSLLPLLLEFCFGF